MNKVVNTKEESSGHLFLNNPLQGLDKLALSDELSSDYLSQLEYAGVLVPQTLQNFTLNSDLSAKIKLNVLEESETDSEKASSIGNFGSQNVSNEKAIAKVLVEELEEEIDVQINSVDHPEEEEQIVAAVNDPFSRSLNRIKGDTLIENKNRGEELLFRANEVIVHLKESATEAEIQALYSQIGATVLEKTPSEEYQLWQVDNAQEAINLLNLQPEIMSVGLNYVVKTTALPNDPRFDELWGLNNTGQAGGTPDADIDAPEAWDINTGDGSIIVGVIDTGVDYTHPDLVNNIWTNPGEIAGNGIDDDGNGYIDDYYGWDFAYDDNDPMDVFGHGTHVAGTIAAEGNNGIGVTGVNWDAQIMPIKFLNDDGSGSTFDAIQAVEYATLMGADLTNNSWGGGGYSQPLYDAIAASGEAGQLFVAAAGNNGTDNDLNPSYPSSYDLDNIIAVAATGHQDQLAWYSQYGLTSVDLAAPGGSLDGVDAHNILSTIPGNDYDYFAGTSMATPHVAGAAALVWSEKPTLTAEQVKNYILGTVDLLPSLDGKVLTGGRLNLNQALLGPQPGAIEGNKWHDLDQDGVWDNGEPALAGWTIFLDEDGDKQLDPAERSSVTDSSGYYTFIDLIAGNYIVAEVQQEGWMQSYPTIGSGVIFEADFSDAGGVPSLDGFVVDNTGATVPGLWHLSTGRGNEAGHSADDSMYFGQNEDPNGGGNYDVGDTAGRITSPTIDLTDISHAELSFNYFFESEGYGWDVGTVLISANGGEFNPIGSSETGLITNPTTGWTNATVDLSDYADSTIQVQFDFDTFDGLYNDYEGWYVDDVKIIDIADGTHHVSVGNGETVNGVNFGNKQINPTTPIITLTVSPASVNEDGTDNLVYTFTRTDATTNPLTVNFTTGGTATQPGLTDSDYTVSGGTLSGNNGTITFEAGSSTATLTVNPTDDSTFEPDETVIVNLASGTGYDIGTPSVATGTILNDDPPPQNQFQPDFNLDGKRDFVWRNEATGRNVVWYMDGATLIDTDELLSVNDPNWQIVGAGDPNGDQNTDIYWRNEATGRNVVWYMNGATRIDYDELSSVNDPNWQIVGIGDADGDSLVDDIYWRNQATGTDVVWFMDGASRTDYDDILQVSNTDWQIVSVGDLDGDSLVDDLLWRNQVTGRNVEWFMECENCSSTAELLEVTNMDWQIVGTGDATGDQKTDIFWRNQVDGRNVCWAMDGTNITSVDEFPQVTNTDWQIVI
jgi:subtilisin family serine protease